MIPVPTTEQREKAAKILVEKHHIWTGLTAVERDWLMDAIAQALATEAAKERERWLTVAKNCREFDDWAPCCNNHVHRPDCPCIQKESVTP